MGLPLLIKRGHEKKNPFRSFGFPGEGWWHQRVNQKSHYITKPSNPLIFATWPTGKNWLVVTGTMLFWMAFHFFWEWNNHPNWRTHIFQRGWNHQLGRWMIYMHGFPHRTVSLPEGNYGWVTMYPLVFEQPFVKMENPMISPFFVWSITIQSHKITISSGKISLPSGNSTHDI